MKFKFLLPVILFSTLLPSTLSMKKTRLVVKELPDSFRYSSKSNELNDYPDRKLSDSDTKIIRNLRDALANRMGKDPIEIPLVHVYDSVINFFDFRFGKKFSSGKEISDLLICLVGNELDNITCPLCYADNYTKYTENMNKLCEIHDDFFKEIFSFVKECLKEFRTPGKLKFGTNRDSIFNAPKKLKSYHNDSVIHGRNLTNLFESM